MSTTTTRLPVGEASRLGKEHFERDIKGKLKPEDGGKWICIEVLSGDFEFVGGDPDAPGGLRSRHPGGHFFLMRAVLAPDDCDRILTPFLREPL